MPAIKFDFDLNIQTVIAVILFISSIVGFGWNIRANQKVAAAQYADIKTELVDVKVQLGEIRRLHLAVSDTVQSQGKSIEVVAKISQSNKKQITENTKVIKTELPKVLATVETLKKG